ncbi:MAG: hypothetical protein ACPG21_01265 [Crocinitomicaceae bacterium]
MLSFLAVNVQKIIHLIQEIEKYFSRKKLTIGKNLFSYSISAGLDYPGIGPHLAHLIHSKRASVIDATDQEALDAAFFLAQKEGIIPALESAHALVALNKMEIAGKTIVLNLSGRGDKDLSTFQKEMK